MNKMRILIAGAIAPAGLVLWIVDSRAREKPIESAGVAKSSESLRRDRAGGTELSKALNRIRKAGGEKLLESAEAVISQLSVAEVRALLQEEEDRFADDGEHRDSVAILLYRRLGELLGPEAREEVLATMERWNEEGLSEEEPWGQLMRQLYISAALDAVYAGWVSVDTAAAWAQLQLDLESSLRYSIL